MNNGDIHSMVIASDYRVPDPTRVWPLLERNKAALADIGAHHVLVYTSTHDHGRVLVMIGVHSREPIVELLRSRVFFDWFDEAGVEDIPAVFAGEIVDRFIAQPPKTPAAPGVVVAAIASVNDVSTADLRSQLGDRQIHHGRHPKDLGIPGFRRRSRGADPAGVSRRGKRAASGSTIPMPRRNGCRRRASAPTRRCSSADSST